MNLCKYLDDLNNQLYNEMAFGRAQHSRPVTKEILLQLLVQSAEQGATMVSLTTVTQCVKPTRNKPSVYKVSQINGSLNVNYENSVNNRREKEEKIPDFVAQERKWGKHETLGIIEHNGNHYIQLIVKNTRTPTYVMGDNPDNLRVVDKSEIEAFLPKSAPSQTQELDKERIVRNYSFNSIAAITIKDQEYYISDMNSTSKAVLDLVNPPGI